MKLEVLVATMHQKDYSLLEKMNINTDAVIINQCEKNSIEDIDYREKHVKWINKPDRGLSKSRNLALRSATADICILADDDVEYVKDYEQRIVEQFKLYPKADIIAFKVEGIEKKFKNYYNKPRKLNFITLMKVASVEIAFRLESIKKANIHFDELFGAGSKFIMGEENIFLSQCLKHNLKLIYVPKKIADLHMGDSTWFKGFNKEYFISKGAMFAAISKKHSLFFILQFSIRKYKLYRGSLTLFQAMYYMMKSRRQYLSLEKA